MESPKKTCNDQEKKKMVIKLDGGFGGIGAVILLGGALATAALASAFLVRVKGRSFTKDRRRCYQNPPPENNKQNEQDEENKGQEIVFADRQPSHVFEHPSKEAIKEVVLENDNTEAFLVFAPISTLENFLQDEDKIEINGGTPGDVEASYLCPNRPKKLEKDAVSDDGFIIVGEDFPLLEEKSSLDSQNKMPEDEKTKVKLTKENVSNDYSKENTNTEKDHVEKEDEGEREKNDDGGVEVMGCKEGVEVSETQPREEEMEVEGVHIDQKKVEEGENMELDTEREVVEGLSIDDGEISEEIECLEAIAIAKMDLCKDGSSQEVDPVTDIVVSESHSEEEEEVKALLPEFDSVVVEHENSNEESREDEAKYVDKSGEEEERETEKGIVPRKCDELSDLIEENEENIFIPHENKEEKILQMVEELIHGVTKEGAAKDDIIDSQEVSENKISSIFDAQKMEKNEIKQEPLSPKDNEIIKDDSNKEVLEKNTEKGVGEEVVHHVNIEAAKDDVMYDEADGSTEESENKSSDEEEEIVEESSLETSESSTESNPDAVLPAESPKPKLFNHEVEGKIQEAKTVKEGEKVFTSEKIFSNKFMVTNSSKRRMVIGMLSLASSLSCSWFFGLSFVKLCIVLFLTMLVSEIHGY